MRLHKTNTGPWKKHFELDKKNQTEQMEKVLTFPDQLLFVWAEDSCVSLQGESDATIQSETSSDILRLIFFFFATERRFDNWIQIWTPKWTFHSPSARPCCLLYHLFLAGKRLHSAAMWAELRRPKKTFVHLRAKAEKRTFTQRRAVCWRVGIQ